MVGDAEIEEGVKTVKKFKKMAEESKDGKIMITQQDKDAILHGVKLMNSSTNDVGELVVRPFRMCGFVPVNIPILCGILLSAPTMRNTIFF